MAVQTITVEAISHKFEKFAVMAGDKWYNTKAEFAAEWPEKPVVGDTITFDDGGKKYLGRMKIVKKGDGPRAGGATPAGKSGGYSSLGVEVGHASNLAMRMMEQDRAKTIVGSTEYYKLLIERTETVYKLMGGLKKKLGTPEVTATVGKPEPAFEEPKPAPVEDSSDDLSDLFS